jgi:hypothetical protein
MKKILFGVVYIYFFLSLFIFVPIYNYKYANENGFLKWIVFGEVVATTKALIWPHYFFQSKLVDNHWTDEDMVSNRHYLNSKKSCDEALKIVISTGDVSELAPDVSKSVTDLIQLSILEADKVGDEYLMKIHPDFIEKYKENYKKGLKMLLDGLMQNNQAYVLAGSYGYNDYVDWMNSNESKLNFPSGI